MDGRPWPAQIPGHAAHFGGEPNPDQTVSSLPTISSLAAPTDAWNCTIFQPPERRARVAVILSMAADPSGNTISAFTAPQPTSPSIQPSDWLTVAAALKFRALRLHGPEQIVRVVPPFRGVCPNAM
jgi:hypothetical protein